MNSEGYEQGSQGIRFQHKNLVMVIVLRLFLVMCKCVCVHVYMYSYEDVCIGARGIGYPENGDSCEMGIGAGN